MLELERAYVVSNGDQTRTIYDALAKGGSFEAALATREREPDAPNFTPRISGLLDLRGAEPSFALSLLKANRADPERTDRTTFRPAPPPPGFGLGLTTYQGDGSPLPPFEGRAPLAAAERVARGRARALLGRARPREPGVARAQAHPDRRRARLPARCGTGIRADAISTRRVNSGFSGVTGLRAERPKALEGRVTSRCARKPTDPRGLVVGAPMEPKILWILIDGSVPALLDSRSRG